MAGSEPVIPARDARTAGDLKPHEDPIARSVMLDARADGEHFADDFVAHGVRAGEQA
jgi:hypothetical protein